MTVVKAIPQLIAVLGTLIAFAGEPYSQIHRIFAGWPEKIEPALKANPGAFKDGIIIAAFPKELERGPDFVKEFENQKAFCERMRSLGVKVQFAMSSTIGHADDYTSANGRPVMVRSDGKPTKAMSCPRSDVFKRHVADLFARYAALHPEVIWWDDDFRMANHAPADYACFCGDCIAKFNAFAGTSYDRVALIQAVTADAVVGGRKLRQIWRDFNRQALTDLVKISADAAHAVDPDVGIGFMVISLEQCGMMYATPDFPKWNELARNRAGRVWYRHGCGAYVDARPEDIFFKTLEIARLCALSEAPGVVNWTEGVIVPFNRRAKSMKLTFLEAALNVGLAGAHGDTYDASKGNLDEQLRDTSVIPMMGRRRAELDLMRGLVDGKHQLGLLVPALPDGVYPEGPVRRFGDLYNPGDLGWRRLLYIGVPLTFRPAHAACELPKGINPRELDSAYCEKLKDDLDQRCGGRMPSRVNSVLRLGQSVWESPDGSERIVFLWNFDYDDATDVKLIENRVFTAEELVAPVKPNGETGPFTWRALGRGDTFAVPLVPALSVKTIRLRSVCRPTLEETFRSPPLSARPETWWHWMNGNVTREGIVADLDAMAAIGIGGVHIFDAGCSIPAGPLEFNTPEWFDTVGFAVAEAAKRRMSVTLANCSGYSAAGGPWIAASNAMKTVVYTTTDVVGPKRFDGILPQPENRHGFYEDIAVLAYPVPAAETPTMEDAGGRTSMDVSGTTTVCTVEFPTPYRASSLEFRLRVLGWDLPARLRLEAQIGDGWRTLLATETYAIAQGQIDENARAFPFEETAAAKWRLVFDFPQAAKSFSLDRVRLTRGVRIPNVANKAFYLRSYEGMRVYRADSDQTVPLDSVVDLTDAVKQDGQLAWTVPEGKWRLLRIGSAANGKCCHPASAKGVGFESDKLSKRATDLHFDSYIGRMCDRLGPELAGRVEFGFNSVLVDSWEAGSQNWTQGFADEFRRRKGYDLRRYLPTLAGAVVGGVEESERFLADYREVISHLFAENFADELARKCHERGLKLVAEPYGTFPSTPELYVRAADIPMCEFWVPPAFGLGDKTVRLVSDLVHRSRPGAVIAAESFTGKPDESRWQQDPFSLKAVGDQMYAIGVNRIVYHRYAHQPWTDPRYSPGMTMGAWGTHFERTETWWYEAKEWISYQTRCQALLQAGVYVDSCRDPALRWLERRYDDGTVGFFVACGNDEARTVKAELPAVGGSVELWDAETGEITTAEGWYAEDGRTHLPLAFKPSGSVFVMFRPKATPGAVPRRRFTPGAEQAVEGPWRVSFTATYEPPAPIVLERLTPLSEHAVPDVRYFSGSALYVCEATNAVCRTEAGGRVVLDLGEVKNLAEVTVNGHRYPVLWRPPFRVDITDAVRNADGRLDLSVRVVNLWVNRLIGDENLPPDVRWKGCGLAEIPNWVKSGKGSPTGRRAFTTWHHWRKDEPLPKSGLIGPVRLICSQEGTER